MNPMIEAAARALAREFDKSCRAYICEPHETQEYVDEHWPKFVPDALAALRAMREVPVTDGMYQAWNIAPATYLPSRREICNANWSALLGAVIEGGE